jgi:hypothetical protein
METTMDAKWMKNRDGSKQSRTPVRHAHREVHSTRHTSSTRQFEQALQQCLDIHNANPKPFVWAKPADDILFRREFEGKRHAKAAWTMSR